MRHRGTISVSRSRTLRLAVTVATLFAFLFQALAVQTHIHNVPALSQSHGKAPSGDDSSACQMCQAVLHAGAYLMPVAATPHVVSVETVASLAAAAAPLLTVFTAHGWNSRAPPGR
jgi:hypothetical protein